MTPEEQEREAQYEQDQSERIDRRHAEMLERRQRVHAVIQAFSLQDVKGCTRLGLITYKTLAGAREQAARLDGNRLLAQRNREYRHTFRNAPYDDYEVYRCDPGSRSGGGSQAPVRAGPPPGIDAAPPAPPPE
jgi:hypothetical protein